MSRIILSATAAVRLDENRFRRIVLKRRIWLEIRLICLFRKTYYLNGISRAARDFYTSFDTITSISTRIDNAKIFLKKKKNGIQVNKFKFFFCFRAEYRVERRVHRFGGPDEIVVWQTVLGRHGPTDRLQNVHRQRVVLFADQYVCCGYHSRQAINRLVFRHDCTSKKKTTNSSKKKVSYV